MLGEMLMQLRKKQGLSQQEVADRLNVSRQTISNWECGQAAPALDKAAELAALYGVSLDELAAAVLQKPGEDAVPKGRDLHLLYGLEGKVCMIECEDSHAEPGNVSLKAVRIVHVDEETLVVEDPASLVPGAEQQTIRVADVKWFVIEQE